MVNLCGRSIDQKVMGRDERQQLQSIIDEIAGWVDTARAVLAWRAQLQEAGQNAERTLRHDVIDVRHDGSVTWRILPIRPRHITLFGDLARQSSLSPVRPDDPQTLHRLTAEVPNALSDAKAVLGTRRFFSIGAKRETGRKAAEFLQDYRKWGHTTGIPQLLHRLDERQVVAFDPTVAAALADQVGLWRRLGAEVGPPALVDGAAVANVKVSVTEIQRTLQKEAKLRSAAEAAGVAVRKREVRRLLSEMSVDRLKDVTRDRLRIGPLLDVGVKTVQAVLDWGGQLERQPGIGPITAKRMRGAARTLWQTTYDEMPVRIDIKNRTAETTELLHCLRAWESLRTVRGATTDLAGAAMLAQFAHALDADVSHLLVFPVASSLDDFLATVAAVNRRAALVADAARDLGSASSTGLVGPWEDFLARPADYYALLAELGLLTEDERKTHGDLPDAIVEAVRRLELDIEHLSASLRGYQSFGARFALVQRKVIIGDEMGLGKTVEALAVMAHLRAKGSHHAIVVCPAAVVTNWIREIAAKSSLRPHRLHGPGRDAAARSWERNGGVAVTTFESLSWFEGRRCSVRDLGCVVVDEAHYIKNPTALRTQRTVRLTAAADRALLLTGTPLENRLDEFRSLVGYLRPNLVVDADELAPHCFRRQVAPVYLRRNQEDVLTELPELVEVDEWLPMSVADTAAYRDAVQAGNFMAMRQAAMVQGTGSEKVRRLIEIVEEAEDNGRRVIVFSHFRGILDGISRALPGTVFGPLTGSVPAAARQVMVDRFSAAGHGAVLVAQIVAGGVGLNIQAASVVVICEPQLKPTTEWQAIARARRMGQLKSVQVHRLLSEEGVDLRIIEILARKRALFDEFARVSETAGIAPEALDVSEADLARQVIAAERERLFKAGAGAVTPLADHST